MQNPFRGRGFKDYREEVQRREEVAEQKKGQIWRYYLTDNDEDDAPMRFLTDEPILYYGHRINDNGKWLNITCTGEDCEYCADGKKPQYLGAFLVVDGREFEIDARDSNGQKTGKKTVVKDRLKILSRGSKDLAKLDRLNTKYGLLNRTYLVTKVGTSTATTYEFDRGEVEELTKKQLQKLLEQLPERYKGMDVYDIVEDNIFGSDKGDDKPKKPRKQMDEEEDIVDVDEEEEEVKPKKLNKKTSISSKPKIKIKKK